MTDLEDMIKNMGASSGFQADTAKAQKIMEMFWGFMKQATDPIEQTEFTGEEPYLQPNLDLGDKPLIVGNQPAVKSLDSKTKIEDLLSKMPITTSRVTDDQAKSGAIGIMAGTMTGMAVLETVGLVAEIVSLGQIETVTVMIQDLMSMSGLPDLARELFKVPFIRSVLIPYEQIYNAKYTPYLPSSTDLVRMRLREAIGEEEYNKALAYQGYEEKWRTAWWDAHWVLPSISQVYEMYFRGLDIPYITFDALGKRITKVAETEEDKITALEQFLKVADYEPLWHENLLTLKENLPSKMDLRLMSQRVDLDPTKVTEALSAEGLRADWLEPYTDTVLNYRLGDLFSSRANTAKRLYKNGQMELDVLKIILTDSKYSEKEREIYISIAELERTNEEMQDVLTIGMNHFKYGRMTLDELFSTLTAVGYTETKAQIITDIMLSKMKVLPAEVTAPEEPTEPEEPET